MIHIFKADKVSYRDPNQTPNTNADINTTFNAFCDPRCPS